MIIQLAMLAMLQQPAPPPAPDKSYLFFVALEGSDEIVLMRYGAKGLQVEHRTPLAALPGEPESPNELYRVEIAPPAVPTFSSLNGHTTLLSSAHGFAPASLAPGPRQLTLSPDGRWYFVATVHGFPSGMLLKVRIAADSSAVRQPPDTVRSQEQLGGNADAVQISPDGLLAWVTGPMSADSSSAGVTIIYLSSMIEAGQIPTCGGARGSRLTADGAKHYSVCSATDALVEIDARAMKVSRKLPLSAAGQKRCAPSAVAIVPDGSRIFVACAGSDEVVEVNGSDWSVVRRVPVAAGPSAIAVTGDGARVVVVAARDGGVSLLDAGGATARPLQLSANYRNAYAGAASGGAANVARVDLFDVTAFMLAAAGFGTPLPALQGTPVGVTISTDQRYAFVTTARPELEPGTVAVIDLASSRVVASLDFGRRPAGIAFWKVVP